MVPMTYAFFLIFYLNFKVSNCLGEESIEARKRPMSFALLLDVNTSDGDLVGIRRVPWPDCGTNRIYDPYFKKCRQLVCAVPGYDLVNGRCVWHAADLKNDTLQKT